MTAPSETITATATNGPPAAVELRDVHRTYGHRQAEVRALDDVSVEFPSGSWTAVMGPSGSGKSTLLHSAAGLERVSSGQVLLAGQDITAATDNELTELRRSDIGFVGSRRSWCRGRWSAP